MSGTGWGGKTDPKTGLPIQNVNPNATVGSQVWGQGTPTYQAYQSWLSPTRNQFQSPTTTSADWNDWYKAALGAGGGAGTQPIVPGVKKLTSGGSGSRGGGGGGGGMVAPPTLNQGQLDWYASMLKGATPGQLNFSALDLPDWNDVNITPFDTGLYDTMRGALGEAVTSDRSAASGAYDQLSNYLQSNYSNPYSSATYATSQNVPGATQTAMQRMLAAQGQAPSMSNETYRQGQSADQAFGNVLSLLGSNEDVAQRNRLSAVMADRGTTNRALDMAALQGNTAIGLQQGQAKQAWQQRADDRALLNAQQRAQLAQQEALANWTRQNEVGDTNVGNRNTYNQSILSALTNLLPQLIAQGGTLNLPDLAALGLNTTNV